MMLKSDRVVLVIDRETQENNITNKTLQQAGYHLVSTDCDPATLNESDLAVVDLYLIDYDLWQAYKPLPGRGSSHDLRSPAIVAMIDLVNIDKALKDLHLGIDHLILRPFTGDLLLDRIEQVLKMKGARRLAAQEDRMAAVNRLTALIAHEINNPLQSLQNCIHMIQFGQLSEQALSDYIGMVNEEVARLSKEVKQTLDFYRPGNLKRQRADPNELVNQVLAKWALRLQDSRIDLLTDMDNSVPHIMAVGSQIEQAISNLVENAVEAMPEGGELLVRTSLVDRQVIIEIVDNGTGIPETVGEQVFEPFMSLKGDRVGLGLTISYSIISAHHGTLELIQDGNRGANFRISLPVG